MTKLSSQVINRVPEKLVENRVVFVGSGVELSIYDTYLDVERVKLKSDELTYCGMLTGRKVMHSDDRSSEFVPGESFIIAPGKEIEIDFPEASLDAPTTCMTVEITRERVVAVAEKVLEPSGLSDIDFSATNFLHSRHSQQTQYLLERMIHTFSENHPDRSLLIDLEVSELLIRLMREKTRDLLLNYSRRDPTANVFNAVLHQLENSMDTPLDVDALCITACMSRSRLYNEFKNRLGSTPGQYQKQLRMKKALELLRCGVTISQVCFELGFQNLSHFSRTFKQKYGYSPRHYIRQVCL